MNENTENEVAVDSSKLEWPDTLKYPADPCKLDWLYSVKQDYSNRGAIVGIDHESDNPDPDISAIKTPFSDFPHAPTSVSTTCTNEINAHNTV